MNDFERFVTTKYRREAMKRKHLSRAVLIALVIVAGVEGHAFRTEAVAQTSQASRNLPMFEVDPSWPKVPAKWKLGDVSSIAIDAQGMPGSWHRPRNAQARSGRDGRAADNRVPMRRAILSRAWGGRAPVMNGSNGNTASYRLQGLRVVWAETIAPGLASGLKPVADDHCSSFTQDGKL